MAAVAFGCEGEGEGEVDPREEGEAQEPRARVGASGRRDRGGGAWRPYPPPSPARGCGGDLPLFRPRSGEQGRGGNDRARWARPAGPGVGPVGPGSSGGKGFSLLLFFVCFSPFVFSFYLFIFFSVLIHLKVFRHFIKMCLLHHNYRCNN